MKRVVHYILAFLTFYFFIITCADAQNGKNKGSNSENVIDLSGEWQFQIDSLNVGVAQCWFSKKLNGSIILPGSMTTNRLGNNITLNTQWTGQIVDSSWFYKPEFAPYRLPGHIKVPFWLQPIKYYKGAAWYQKSITIPTYWARKYIELFIERSHWETSIWVDGKMIGVENSLATPHVFNLTEVLTPGKHLISIRIDNRIKDFNVGQNSHSISDHTQGNWNGLIGKLNIQAKPALYLADVQLFPDVEKKVVTAKIKVNNISATNSKGKIELLAVSQIKNTGNLKVITKSFEFLKNSTTFEIVYPMGQNPFLWSEFHPNLYKLQVRLISNTGSDVMSVDFGMRNFLTKGTQFTVNGNITFLRGTLECAIFPKTGYPPMDLNSWVRIFSICKSFGLNHMRFHSWCPPEAAFVAADRIGFYLQVEVSSWANQGATIGDGSRLDQYILEESQRILKVYGNHPSFCMMAYGNEPAGERHEAYLSNLISIWKGKDSRRLYTTASGWPIIPESDFNSSPDPRIQAYGAGLTSIINSDFPKSDYDWYKIIEKWKQPTISHEIGQWCAYPDFGEIRKYTGILKAKNFEIFRDKLQLNGLLRLSDSFLFASGKLQVLCYKADIEAALRTPGFGGFQLLDLHDFPGQGTALVGVLNSFWQEKGYISGNGYKRFCNSVVPLVRLSKMIYQSNEVLSVQVEVANFGETPLSGIVPKWSVKDTKGKMLFEGQLNQVTIPIGNSNKLGVINQSLSSISKASQVILSVSVGEFENSWNLFVYPDSYSKIEGILATQVLDNKAIECLKKGGSVLLTLKKGSLKREMGGDIKIGFSSIFWNTAWTGGQPPTTLGVLVNPLHPALRDFPTDYYSDWQWWDAMSHSNAIILDSIAIGIQPIVRVIDDWVTARSLGLIFECKVGKGKLIVSGIDLFIELEHRAEARQLLYSLKRYMASKWFQPTFQVPIQSIQNLIKS